MYPEAKEWRWDGKRAGWILHAFSLLPIQSERFHAKYEKVMELA